MQKQFEQIAGDDGQIDLNEFKKALGVKKVISPVCFVPGIVTNLDPYDYCERNVAPTIKFD